MARRSRARADFGSSPTIQRVALDLTIAEARTLATVLDHISGVGEHERRMQRLRIALHKIGVHRYAYGTEIVVGTRHPDAHGRKHATILLYDHEAHRRQDEWAGGPAKADADALADRVPREQSVRRMRPRAIKLEE